MRRQVTTIYQLKIVLSDVRPQIMRRIHVSAAIRLDDLHMVLQTAMGWTNSHLHSFAFGDREFSMPYEEHDLEELQMEDERTARLSTLIKAPKETFGYDYDFGDNWRHIVTLEKVLPAAPDVKYSLCLEGKRACPPEDCGGTWGYSALLKVLRSPAHPDYDHLRGFVGRNFDPEVFDVAKVNQKLRRLRV